MKSENENANLDEMISKAIGGDKPAFDFEQWKQDHPEQIAAYKEQTAAKPHRLLKYAGAILSAAAMIFLAVMLLPIGDKDSQPVEYQAKILTAKISLPANVPTIARLNRIFRIGDIEAVDAFCQRATRRSGPRPEKLTVRQLLNEMETNSNKTKGNSHEDSSYNNTDDVSSTA
jgi:hypothetical protein